MNRLFHQHNGALWRAMQARKRGLVALAVCAGVALSVLAVHPNPTLQARRDLEAAVKAKNAVDGAPNRSIGETIEASAQQEFAASAQQQLLQQEQLKEKQLTDDQWAAAQRAAIQRP
jgi:hypothetical protein